MNSISSGFLNKELVMHSIIIARRKKYFNPAIGDAGKKCWRDID